MSDERIENSNGEVNSGMYTDGENKADNLFRTAGSMTNREDTGSGNGTGHAAEAGTYAAGAESAAGGSVYSGTSGTGADYGRTSAYGTGTDYSGTSGTGADYSRTFGTGEDYGRTSGYGSGANYGRAAGAGANYGRSAGTGTNTEGGGRYYSYTGEESSGAASSPAVRRGRDREKAGRRLVLVLAVILVFIFGAGAGAFISSRNAATSLTGSAPSAKSRVEAETGAADKEDGSDSEEETAAGGENKAGTIARVEDSLKEADLSDTTVADVAESVMPAIVSVYNKYTEESQFFGRTYTQEGESAGSGIIIEETDGELLIVTNNHVVEGADSLSVQFINEENCEASLKGTDVSSDLAVIAVSVSDLTADTRDSIAIAELGDSDALRIGEHAIAIGNALGYGQSLTVGYISALNREMTSENGITGTFIQTDAAINPGNSGGALLNSRGQVIGINSNKIGGSAIEGMGFAIPISKAIPIIDNLKTQESKTKVAEEDQGVLGIYGLSVTSDVASAYGLPMGAYVEEIIEGSGAAESDLQQGDIITAIDGQTITGMEDLQKQLVYYSAGTEVKLTVQHPMEGGQYEEREISVKLSKRDSLSSSSSGNSRGRAQQEQQAWPSEEEDSSIFGFPFGF